MNTFKKVTHTFEPIYDKNSTILILGTMPSDKSREANFYYMNPQNLFWKVLSKLLSEPFPETIEKKKAFLLKNRIAIWDVLKSCDIEASSDSSIKNPEPNDFSQIFNIAKISAVFTNGTKATSLYKKFCSKETGIESICLPSTSPANRKFYTYDKILEEWSKILPYLNKG